MSLNNIYVRWFEAADLLAGGKAAKVWDTVTFDRRNKTTRTGEASWRADRKTTVYGMALWWTAELVPGVSLSTGPLSPRTHWEQLYMPALAPIAVGAGQTFAARLRSTTSYDKGTNLTWVLTVSRGLRPRGAAPVPRPGEGLPAVRRHPSPASGRSG